MQKNLLHMFLQRVAEGDTEATRQVPQKLAERLMYIPVKSPPASGDAQSTEVRIHAKKTNTGKAPSFMCFSNQRFFKEWAHQHGHNVSDVVSLLLGDFCTAVLNIEKQAQLTIDVGVEHSVTFNHPQLDSIARYVSPLFFELGTTEEKPSVKIKESETPTAVRSAKTVPQTHPLPSRSSKQKKGLFGFLK